jgi:magnesium-protoporphyrin O-methyltransferase
MGGDCCGDRGYQTTFGERFASRVARRYHKRGLNRTQQRLVSFVTERGLEDASVLEIGGGIGEIQVELLRRGARQATNTEISTNYEREAAELLSAHGVGDRVTRRIVDIATAPDAVEPADVVVLHRVVCCYPDYEALLTAAAGHARRLLVFTHPAKEPVTRTIMGCDNLLRRMRGNEFRSFVHPPEAMIASVEAQGLTLRYRHRGWPWHIAGFER